jgi:hypothetical protein
LLNTAVGSWGGRMRCMLKAVWHASTKHK